MPPKRKYTMSDAARNQRKLAADRLKKIAQKSKAREENEIENESEIENENENEIEDQQDADDSKYELSNSDYSDDEIVYRLDTKRSRNSENNREHSRNRNAGRKTNPKPPRKPRAKPNPKPKPEVAETKVEKKSVGGESKNSSAEPPKQLSERPLLADKVGSNIARERNSSEQSSASIAEEGDLKKKVSDLGEPDVKDQIRVLMEHVYDLREEQKKHKEEKVKKQDFKKKKEENFERLIKDLEERNLKKLYYSNLLSDKQKELFATVKF